jgi:hypothetical protein
MRQPKHVTSTEAIDLFHANAGLAVWWGNRIARRFPTLVEQPDAVQTAFLALWQAVLSFDPAKGPLAAFAGAHVRGRLYQWVSQSARWRRPGPLPAVESDFGAEQRRRAVAGRVTASTRCRLPRRARAA